MAERASRGTADVGSNASWGEALREAQKRLMALLKGVELAARGDLLAGHTSRKLFVRMHRAYDRNLISSYFQGPVLII